jgi:hypothetical protein
MWVIGVIVISVMAGVLVYWLSLTAEDAGSARTATAGPLGGASPSGRRPWWRIRHNGAETFERPMGTPSGSVRDPAMPGFVYVPLEAESHAHGLNRLGAALAIMALVAAAAALLAFAVWLIGHLTGQTVDHYFRS